MTSSPLEVATQRLPGVRVRPVHNPGQRPSPPVSIDRIAVSTLRNQFAKDSPLGRHHADVLFELVNTCKG